MNTTPSNTELPASTEAISDATATAPAALTPVTQLQLAVKDALKVVPDKAKEAYIAAAVTEAVGKAATKLTKGFDKLRESQKELKKLEATDTYTGGYDTKTNKPLGEPVYSKDQAKKLKEATDAHNKLYNALNKAVEGDYSELDKILGGDKPGQ